MMTDNGTTDPYSSEASEFLRALTEGKRVELEFDTELWDGYGRLLAYVYMDGGLSVQDQLLINGLVRVMEAYTYRKKDLFLDLQERAGNSRIGLWSSDQASALTGAENFAMNIAHGRDVRSDVSSTSERDDAWNGVYLSEIFASPDPKAKRPELSSEWIELGRDGSQALSLSGWTLTVGKKSRVLDSRTGFGSGRFLLVSAGEWKLQLPNAGGTIVLRSPYGSVSADIVYPSLKSTQSYAWEAPAEAFCISTPTPLADNRCAGPVIPTKRASTAGKRTIAYAASYREQLRNGAAATIDLSGGAADDISASWLLFMTLPGAAMGVLGTVFGTRMGWIRVEK
jgi:micrococcal nuclease